MRLDELGQQFDLELEHEDVDSVSGLVLTLLGRPPRVGDSVRYDRLQFEVTAVKGHGVEECAVAVATLRGFADVGAGLGSAWRSTSRVTGAVSPSPNARNFSR